MTNCPPFADDSGPPRFYDPDEHGPGDGRTPRILTIEQAARMMQVSRSTMYHWISTGKLSKSVKRGKPVRLDRDLLIDEFFDRL